MKYLRVIIALLLISAQLLAQDKAKMDKIYLNNGSTLEVQVKKVGATSVEYTYPGETVTNEELTANIRTIVFSSGRVQQFNSSSPSAQEPQNTTQQTPQMQFTEVRQNVMAVLPVTFFNQTEGIVSDDKSKMAQAQIYDFFDDNAQRIAPIQLLDGRETNSLLKKSNIAIAGLDEISIEDLQKILGVEYLVLSKVSYTTKNNITTNQSTVGKNEQRGNKNVVAVNTTTSSNQNIAYAYIVALEIYKNGKKIYNETRKPFFNMEDSWKDAYQYMLKRTPIYNKK